MKPIVSRLAHYEAESSLAQTLRDNSQFIERFLTRSPSKVRSV